MGGGGAAAIFQKLVWIQTLSLVPTGLLKRNFPLSRAHISSTQAVPALFAALAEKPLNRPVLLERARLALLEKELEMTRKEMELKDEMNKRELKMKDKEVELTTEMKDKEVELANEMKDKEVELANELTKVTKDWKDDQAALFKKQRQLEDANSKLRDKTFEILVVTKSVSLRSALGKFNRDFGKVFFYSNAHVYYPIYTRTPPSQSHSRRTKFCLRLGYPGGQKLRTIYGIGF